MPEGHGVGRLKRRSREERAAFRFAGAVMSGGGRTGPELSDIVLFFFLVAFLLLRSVE